MSKKNEKTSTKKPKEKEEKVFIEGIGRRKTATARVRIYPVEKKKDFLVNNTPLEDYFTLEKRHQIVLEPFEVVGSRFKTTVKVKGSGLSAQAEAVRLGLSRALVLHNQEWKGPLKKRGFLARDARMVERKKPGLRKARRPQQWRKR